VSSRSGRGQVSILVAGIIVIFLLVFFVVGIDFARMYYVRGELQNATDAAALAGAPLLTCASDSDSSFVLQEDARTAAQTFAGRNNAAGAPVGLQLNLANVNSTAIEGNGDIVVGNWDATTSTFTAATGSTDLLINAIRVIARRTSEAGIADVKTGGNPVGLLFGNIVGWFSMNVVRQAIAVGCLGNMTPVTVNEYWMGNRSFTGGGGGQPCKQASNSDSTAFPYKSNHLYPNSFVRPPNGNVGPLPPSSSSDCNAVQLTGVNAVTANGPLDADCNLVNVFACLGRPSNSVGTLLPRAGRVFPIVGADAANPFDNEFRGVVDLDDRINNSIPQPDDQWYQVSGNTFTAESHPQGNSTKDTVLSYIETGTYPNVPPTPVSEVYQGASYPTPTTNYPSTEPYASTAIFSGNIIGGTAADFYDNGNYQNGKYAPGKKIVVAVYDGIIGGNGNDRRTTFVGFARVTIFFYCNKNNFELITLNTPGTPHCSGLSGTPDTMYGYVADEADSLKQSILDLTGMAGIGKYAKLVK
jgi:Flp pilus assembly protein TadG